jgi:hypothetical protein
MKISIRKRLFGDTDARAAAVCANALKRCHGIKIKLDTEATTSLVPQNPTSAA